VTALCNQPEAFASDLGDDQSRYLFCNEGAMLLCKYVSPSRWRIITYIVIAGDSEVQRTMLELLNQLDGFEPKQNIKVRHWSCV